MGVNLAPPINPNAGDPNPYMLEQQYANAQAQQELAMAMQGQPLPIHGPGSVIAQVFQYLAGAKKAEKAGQSMEEALQGMWAQEQESARQAAMAEEAKMLQAQQAEASKREADFADWKRKQDYERENAQPDTPDWQTGPDGQVYRIDPNTGQVMYSGSQAPTEQPAEEAPEFGDQFKLFTEYDAQTQTFQKIAEANRNIQGANPNGAGDIALLTGFMKLIDPGSVVRPSEFETAKFAQSVPEQLQGYYNQLRTGAQLSQSQRDRIKAEAAQMFGGYEQDYTRRMQQFRAIAESQGFDTSTFVPDWRGEQNTEQQDPLGIL